MGQPLLYSENGDDFIPDGVRTVWKNVRKASADPMEILKSSDKGVTWSTASHTYSQAANEVTFTTAPAVGDILMVTYTTPPHIYENGPNSKVLELGDVWGGCYNQVVFGAGFISDMIDKVPTAVSASAGEIGVTTPLLRHHNWTNDELYPNSSVYPLRPSHAQLDLSPNSPAAKALHYLTAIDNQLYSVMLGKEMVYDSGANTPSDFASVASTTVQAWVSGEIYRITYADKPEIIVVCAAGVSSVAFEAFNETEKGFVGTTTGTIFFTLWNGTGWGDDNTFDVVSGTSTTVDDNGNTVITTTKLTPLPYLWRDE